MSVIAGKVYNDKIVIAADSIVVKGWSKRTGNFAKLLEINNMIIGGTGSAEELSLFFRFAQTHKPESATEKDILVFATEFANWKQTNYNNNSFLKNTYLIAYDGHLFEIANMFINEIKDFAAIGAGEDFANAALYLGHSPEEAVKVACELCCFVSEPIIKYKMKRG
jgi:ATP-dependent protease HslVU (ClpYQ) peptidase subunit